MFTGLTFTEILIVVASILISMALHEAMHAYTSFKLGDTTAQEEGRISFNPLRHIDPFMTVLLPLITLFLFQVPILAAKPVPFNPARLKFDEYGAALVALAGPATNLVLAILGGLLAHMVGSGSATFDALSIFTVLNVGLFVFNMVPIPPLDGSRVLYAFAPEGVQRFMAQLEQFGLFIVFGLVLFVPGFSQVLVNVMRSLTSFLLGF